MSIEQLLIQAVKSLPARAVAIRVSETLPGTITALISWSKGLTYEHFEVVLEENGVVEDGAFARALQEIIK